MDTKPEEKIQPWKAGWVARNASGAQKPEARGLSHGAEKGENVVVGGFTSGVAIKLPPKDDPEKPKTS